MTARLYRLLWIGLIFLTFGLIFQDLFLSGISDFYLTFYLVFFALTICVSIAQHGIIVFVAKRLLQTVFSLFVIATLAFSLLRLIPGGPFDEEKSLPPAIKANIEAKYGLDKPLIEQYARYIGQVATGDLGQSYKYLGRSVTDIISDSFPVSLKLGLYSLLLAIIVGIPLGLLAAQNHNRPLDTASMFVAISGVSVPSFVAAAFAIQLFCYGRPLDLLFPKAVAFMAENRLLLPTGLWETPWHYFLPVLVLGIRPAAVIARLTRASALEVTRSDFIRTARAKGLSARAVLYRHVLRNSLIPVLTYLGPLIAGIISGAFVIESIFAIPGLGKHFIQSAFNRDYPLVMGLTLLFSSLLIISNLLVDILYKIVDPRIEVE